MRQQPLEAKRVAEDIFVFFNFFDQVVWEETLSTPTVTVESFSGVDLDPSLLLLGPPIIDESQVVQKITGGMQGCLYLLTATVVGSSGTLYKVTQDLAIISQAGYAEASTVTLTGDLPDGTVGAFYSHPLQISGGFAPYSPIGLISGAPAWMGFAVVGTQLICSGLPDIPAAYAFTPQVLDAAQTLASAPQALVITKLTLSGNLPNMLAGTVVNFQYTITGGTPPYTSTLGSGALPGGLSMNSSALVTGTTNPTGTFSWIVHTVDVNGVTADLPDTSVISASTMFTDPFPTQSTAINRSLTTTTWGVSRQTLGSGAKGMWSFGDGVLYVDDDATSGYLQRSINLGDSFVLVTGLRPNKNRAWLHKTSTGRLIMVYRDDAPSYSDTNGVSFVNATGSVADYVQLASLGSVVIAGVTLDSIARSVDGGATWAAPYALGQLGGRGPAAIITTPSAGFLLVSDTFPINRKILTSIDGSSGSWIVVPNPPGLFVSNGDIYGIANNGNHVVFINRDNSSGVNQSVVSIDGGGSWVIGANVPNVSDTPQGDCPKMVYANGLFYLCGTSSTVWTSPDGIVAWTARATGGSGVSNKSICAV